MILPSEVVNVSELHPWPRNYNQHDDAQVEALVSSLGKFGQFKNIVIVERGGRKFTLAGHGLVKAAEQAGIERVEAKVAPADWSDEKLEALLVADNRLPQLASPDDEQLAELLHSIRANDDALLAAVGYDSDEVDAMLRVTDLGAVEFREYDEDVENEVETRTCPKCGHEFPK